MKGQPADLSPVGKHKNIHSQTCKAPAILTFAIEACSGDQGPPDHPPQGRFLGEGGRRAAPRRLPGCHCNGNLAPVYLFLQGTEKKGVDRRSTVDTIIT